jgi:hypothetical protein
MSPDGRADPERYMRMVMVKAMVRRCHPAKASKNRIAKLIVGCIDC